MPNNPPDGLTVAVGTRRGGGRGERTAPSAALSRADHPLVRPTARGSRTLMFEAIAKPDGRDAALAEFDASKETVNTIH